jgi:hypothetical protein
MHQEKTKCTTLAFKALMEYFGEQRKREVLDLGPAIGANVDFFSQFSCQFYVADLIRSLESQQPEAVEEETAWDEVFADLLPYDEDTQFDLILAWDVFDYLSRVQIKSLVRHVSRFCESRTILFALVSTRREIPARPRSYHIVGYDKLLYHTATQAIRPCPRYKEPDLRRLMPGFEVKSTYLLRNGIQEYLFTYEPSAQRSIQY